jgi:Fe-S oxidoreductase
VPELPPGVAVCPTCGGQLAEIAVIGADPFLKLLDCVHCHQTFAQLLQ